METSPLIGSVSAYVFFRLVVRKMIKDVLWNIAESSWDPLLQLSIDSKRTELANGHNSTSALWNVMNSVSSHIHEMRGPDASRVFKWRANN